MTCWGYMGYEKGEGNLHHPILSQPQFMSLLSNFWDLEKGSLTFKGTVQLHPVLSDKIAVVLAQPEALVIREVQGSFRV